MSTDSSNPTPTEPRRWFFFKLRTLLMKVTLSAVVLDWVGWELDQRRKAKKVVAWIEEMDCGIGVDDGFQRPSDDGRSWLEKATDKLFGERVRAIGLQGKQLTELSPLMKLKNLEHLFLIDTNVSDEQAQETKKVPCVSSTKLGN